jgi:hypothetical protein
MLANSRGQLEKPLLQQMWRRNNLGYLDTVVPAKLGCLKVQKRCPKVRNGGYSEVSIIMEKLCQMMDSMSSNLDRLIDGEVVPLFLDTLLPGKVAEKAR